MGRSDAINGYYYIDLHSCASSTGKEMLDYEKEWAIAAVPAKRMETDFLTFIADHSNNIFVKHLKIVPPEYSRDLQASQWIKIGTIEQLKIFQKTHPLQEE